MPESGKKRRKEEKRIERQSSINKVQELIASGRTQRDREKVINLLLDDWYKTNRESYMEYWEEGTKGTAMLAYLEEDYPDYYDSLINRNVFKIYRIYGV